MPLTASSTSAAASAGASTSVETSSPLPQAVSSEATNNNKARLKFNFFIISFSKIFWIIVILYILLFSNQIFTLFNSEAKMKNLSIGSFLKLLLIECNNICSINPIESDIDSSSDNLIRNFKSSVDHNYRKEHSTTYYATQLHITPDHLNRTVKTKIGKTAKEYIQTRIATEAKRLLYFTDLSNKEIGYELGFNEPANFSAFFKKFTQISPSSFKKNETMS